MYKVIISSCPELEVTFLFKLFHLRSFLCVFLLIGGFPPLYSKDFSVHRSEAITSKKILKIIVTLPSVLNN